MIQFPSSQLPNDTESEMLILLKLRTVLLLTALSLFSSYAWAQTRPSSGEDRAPEPKLREVQIHARDHGEIFTNDVTGKLDLSRYQQGGHFDCRTFVLPDERGSCETAKLNEFILENWTNKRLAYVRVSYNSRDAGATFHIFVEPDKKGTWTVLTRVVRWHSLPGGTGIEEYPRAYFVEKSGESSNHFSLKLKDKKGRLITVLGS